MDERPAAGENLGHRVLLLLPAVVALAAATAFSFVTSIEREGAGDGADYLAAAQAILAGETYPRDIAWHHFRPPLYPLFIAGLWSLAPGSIVAIKVAQVLLFAGTCWLIQRLGLLAFRDERLAFWGALLYAVNPMALSYVAELQTEPLHTFLVVGATYLSVVGIVHRKTLALGAAGITWGLATLCRPTALFVALVLAGFVAVVLWRRRERSFGLKAGALMIAGLFSAVLPWTFANYRSTGELILTTDAAGFILWIGHHPDNLRLQTGHFATPAEFAEFSTVGMGDREPRRLKAAWEREYSVEWKSLSLMQRSRLWRAEAKKNMLAQPGKTALLEAVKLWAFWRPWVNPNAYSAKAVVATGLWVSTLYLLAISGWRLILRSHQGGEERSRLVLGMLLAIFGAATAVHVMTHVMIRFRLPYVEPFLSMVGGAALSAVAASLVRRLRSA